jgi:hypothetical protein
LRLCQAANESTFQAHLLSSIWITGKLSVFVKDAVTNMLMFDSNNGCLASQTVHFANRVELEFIEDGL